MSAYNTGVLPYLDGGCEDAWRYRACRQEKTCCGSALVGQGGHHRQVERLPAARALPPPSIMYPLDSRAAGEPLPVSKLELIPRRFSLPGSFNTGTPPLDSTGWICSGTVPLSLQAQAAE